MTFIESHGSDPGRVVGRAAVPEPEEPTQPLPAVLVWQRPYSDDAGRYRPRRDQRNTVEHRFNLPMRDRFGLGAL